MGARLARLLQDSTRDGVLGAWLESLPKFPISPPFGCPAAVLEDIRDDLTKIEAFSIRDEVSQVHKVWNLLT